MRCWMVQWKTVYAKRLNGRRMTGHFREGFLNSLPYSRTAKEKRTVEWAYIVNERSVFLLRSALEMS